MGMLRFFLISIVPMATVAGLLSAITKDNPPLSSVDSSGLYQSTSSPDGKIDQIIVTFGGQLEANNNIATDFEVVGYQVSSATVVHGEYVARLNLTLGDVQDTGATPVVKFFPGRLTYIDTSLIFPGVPVVTMTASDGAAPVLDLGAGQAMFRPRLNPSSGIDTYQPVTNNTNPGTIFMSFSERVNVNSASSLRLVKSVGNLCNANGTTTPQTTLDGQPLTSTSHITLPAKCTDKEITADGLGLSATSSNLDLFAASIMDSQNMTLVWRQPSLNTAYYFSPSYDSNTGYGIGNSFDEATMLFLIGNDAICNRGSNTGALAGPVTFFCASSVPVRPKVIASSLDLDGDGVIDTIQVRTVQDRLGYIQYDLPDQEGWSLGDANTTYLNGPRNRADVRIDTYVPNVAATLSSWTLPGFNITGATSERGRILLNVTPSSSSIYTAAVAGALNYNGNLTTWTGNILDAANIVVDDKACPVIVSVMGSGGATNMTITFSEPVVTATVNANSFISLVATTFNTTPFIAVTPAPSPGVYVASFASPLSYKNFGGPLPVKISGLSTILQASGNCPLRRNYVLLASSDTTPPGVLRVLTKDRNGNGRIDGFSVFFNKSLVDETVLASQFTASGFTGLAVVASTLNDSIVDFTVTEAASINTSILPSFAYTSTQTLVDLSNNPLASFNITSSDGVGPYPVSLQTGNTYPSNINLDKIVIQFSENVTGSLVGTDFQITNPSITPDSAVVVSGSTVTLHFTGLPNPYAGSTPQVAYTNRSGQDSAGNLIPSFALNAADRIQPVCGTGPTPAVTQDLNVDGHIDTIYLACTELVTNLSLTSFTVEGYTVINVAAVGLGPCFNSFFCVNITVQQQSFLDTQATPRVNYSASSPVTDFAGNLLQQGMFPVSTFDGVSPVVASVLTQDLNSDGKIDAFRVTFSENVSVSGFSHFTIATYAITGFSVSGSVLVLTASSNQGSIYDGGATPNLSYTGSSDVEDMCTLCRSGSYNILLPTASPIQSLDGVFPIVLSALTAATAGSCKLSSVQISMNENINPSSVNISSFSITGYNIINVSFGGVSPFGFSLNVNSYPLLTPDLVTPNVTYNAPLSVVDNNANHMAAFSLITQDKLAPCLISCAGHVGGSYIAVIFSEPVFTGALSSVLTQNNFQLLSSSNAINGSTVTSNSSFLLSLNATFIESDINFGPLDSQAAVQPKLVHDANNNNASAASCLVMNDDHVQPTLVKVSTVNTNDADLQIDRILLQFDKPIEDSTMDIAAWNVSGYTITSFGTGLTANDQFISLILNPGTVPDTGATPLVTYTRPASGGFADRNRNLLNSTSMTAVDAARPILATFAATIFFSGNIAVATFSEPVYGPGPLSASNFVYNSTNGNADSIQMFLDTDGADAQVSMVLNTLALTDFNADFVVVNVSDLAGNPSVSRPVNVTKGDTVPPVFVSVDTQDLDSDGQIDHLTVTFNESMLPSTFSLNYFSLAGYTLSNVVVNDTVAKFSVVQSGALDGAATPVFNYTPGAVSDLNGNLLGASSNSTRDRVAPFLLDCSSTLPNIVTIDCQFSEAVSAPSSGLTSFMLAGPLAGASVVSAVLNGSMITITLSRVLILNDFKRNGTVDLTSNGPLTDLAGNVGLQHKVFLRNTDVTPPNIADAKTADLDCDGFIDHIVLQFNEGIIDANVNIGDFTLGGGYMIVGKDNEVPPDDDVIFLLVQKQATFDTDAGGFLLTYTAGTLTDLSDNLASNFTYNVRDEAGVALLTVTGNADDRFVYLQFSGPFQTSDLSQLTLQNFSAQKTLLQDQDGSDGNLTILMNGPLEPRDFETPASIIPSVLDLLGNRACNQAVPLTNPDHTAPTIISIATNDENSDGRIDSFIFTCSEPIDELSLRASDFVVANGKYTNVNISGFPPPSRLFKLSVTETNVTDAFATPAVSYTSGSLTDRYGNKLASFANMQSVDRIGPAIIRATGFGSTLTLLFSKPLFNVTNGTMFNFTDVTYFSSGAAPNVITSIIDSQGADSVLSFGMVRAFAAADFGSDSVSGGPKIFDAHGNALNSAARVKIGPGVAVVDAPAAAPGLTDTQVIGIAVGCGGGLLLLILVAVLCVVCKKKGWACFKKKGNADIFDQDQGGFDFGSGGTEMTQSSKGVARLEA